MPITGRTPRECARKFRDHAAKLFAVTVTAEPILLVDASPRFWVSFRRGDAPVAVPLDTRYGKLFFFAGQIVESIPHRDGPARFRLQTVQYAYRIQETANVRDGALLRWEYERRSPEEPVPPRHHLQAPASIRFGRHALDLNRLHLPTGWALMEEIIRFLITDLGVSPPCGQEWPRVLARSEAVFFNDFTGKRLPGVK